MIKKDYIMNQLEMLVKFGAKIIFRDKEDKESILIFNSTQMEKNEILWNKLMEFVKDGRLGQGEDLLFDEIETQADLPNFNTAVQFYSFLTGLGKGQLKEWDFSTEEIRDGFSEICGLYGIVDILF